jgi:hypothetical protein
MTEPERPRAQIEDGVPPASGTVPASSGLSAFLEKIKPYRELIVIAAGAITALSAGVSYAVSYFATKSEVIFLTCRFDTDADLKQRFDTGSVAAKIEWRQAQLKQLTLAFPTNLNRTLKTQLANELNDLFQQQNDINVSLRKEMQQELMTCLRQGAATKQGEH